MTTIKTFIKGHTVLTYYVLVFTISWGGILTLAGPGGIPGTQEQVERLFPFMLLALFAGPSVGSILSTILVDGRSGLRDLFLRLRRWQVGAHWYAVALLLAPCVVAAVLFALALLSPAFQGANPFAAWQAGYNNTVSFTVTVSADPGVANRVLVTIDAVESVAGGGTVNRTYVGSWDLIWGGAAGWLLNSGAFHL